MSTNKERIDANNSKIDELIALVQEKKISNGVNPAIISRTLTEITADNLKGVEALADYCFYRYTTLEKIELPSSVGSIGYQAFAYCSALIDVILEDNVQPIIIDDRAFYDSAVQRVILGDVASMGEMTFYLCRSLKQVIFGENSQLTSIGEKTFYNCSNLTNVSFDMTQLTSIGREAFAYCSLLTGIKFENMTQLTSIGFAAFNGCSSLTEVTIPASVTEIGGLCFGTCTSIKSVVFKGQSPYLEMAFGSCDSIELYDFRNCTSVPTIHSTATIGHATGCQIVIPDALYDEWTTATNWSSLTDVVFVRASEYTE